jgi:hypothetical protein
MAQITVTGDDGRLVHREWVVALQAESDHFLGCFAERMRWAIRDAERRIADAAATAPQPIAAEPTGAAEPAPAEPALIG